MLTFTIIPSYRFLLLVSRAYLIFVRREYKVARIHDTWTWHNKHEHLMDIISWMRRELIKYKIYCYCFFFSSLIYLCSKSYDVCRALFRLNAACALNALFIRFCSLDCLVQWIYRRLPFSIAASLCQNSLHTQMIPNTEGEYCSIGYDSTIV